ncbi:NIPSNAP family protein [Foliimonas ilicis]
MSFNLKSETVRFSPIVELRQYTLHPGRRDELIDLFDMNFVESQEETGMKIIGQFRDLNRPDHFVWLRGFETMEHRREALAAFYGGSVWAAHKHAANATMIDSDDVLLLRPAWKDAGFDLENAQRGEAENAIFLAEIFHLSQEQEGVFADLWKQTVLPLYGKHGAKLIGAFVSEHSENTFPRLPVRANENVFVAFSRFNDQQSVSDYMQALDEFPSLKTHFSKPSERLVLSPTTRSLL